MRGVASNPQGSMSAATTTARCAPLARARTWKLGQFFVFMGASAAIGLSAMLLEGGLAQQDKFLDSKIQIGLVAIGAMAVALWIHRKMKGRKVR